MRNLTIIAFAFLFATITAIGMQTSAASAAPTAEKQASCDKQKKACMDAGARTNSFGVRSVPADVVKKCYAEYRVCTGQK